jgi:hypothetical protein
MRNLRKLIEEYDGGLYEYNTFPKDGLINRFAVTALLLADHKHLDPMFVAQNLIDRNHELRGGIKAIKQKKFKPSDTDKNGRSLQGARIIQFDGDDDFHRSLARLPWNHRFNLGCGTISI